METARPTRAEIPNSLSFASASEAAAAIRSRRVSASQMVEHVLERVRRHNPALNAIVTLDEGGARRRAREADQALDRGELWGPLHGVPVTLKDCHSTAGMRTTCGYAPLSEHVPREDGTVAARLRAAGAVLLGKTNVPTLLAQPQTENPIFGRTNNPWMLDRTPGGSSGGAAAALAAGLSWLEVGSDLAGSIRMPAHFCGVLGLKPTARRVSMQGHIPDVPGFPRFDRVLAVCGPMARSVEDLALAFRILAGPDGRDTEIAPVPAIDAPARPLRELRIAWAPTFPGTPVARSIREALERLASGLAGRGARVEEALPPIDFEAQHALWVRYYKWFGWVAADVWGAPPPGRSKPEQPSARGMLDIAQLRDDLIVAWDRFMEQWDALLCPAAIVTAFPHCPPGTPVSVEGTQASYGQINHHCFPFNITGQPAVVVPIGADPEGLPIGAQLVGRRWQDERLLAVAASVAEVSGPFRPPPGYAA